MGLPVLLAQSDDQKVAVGADTAAEGAQAAQGEAMQTVRAAWILPTESKTWMSPVRYLGDFDEALGAEPAILGRTTGTMRFVPSAEPEPRRL